MRDHAGHPTPGLARRLDGQLQAVLEAGRRRAGWRGGHHQQAHGRLQRRPGGGPHAPWQAHQWGVAVGGQEVLAVVQVLPGQVEQRAGGLGVQAQQQVQWLGPGCPAALVPQAAQRASEDGIEQPLAKADVQLVGGPLPGLHRLLELVQARCQHGGIGAPFEAVLGQAGLALGDKGGEGIRGLCAKDGKLKELGGRTHSGGLLIGSGYQ